jgi:ubiquitin-like 1-activating enzyme E1 B
LGDSCRDEFDEEKEPDSMVLAGWSGPADKQITSSGEKGSVPSSSGADVAGTAEDISVKPGMKRKLSEVLEANANFDAAPNPTEGASSSAQVVEDDDDDVLMYDEDPKLGKRKRLQ